MHDRLGLTSPEYDIYNPLISPLTRRPLFYLRLSVGRQGLSSEAGGRRESVALWQVGRWSVCGSMNNM